MTIVVPSSIRVLMPNGRVTEMKLETYLAGAVVSEMGASAPLEALKAQAVASRTYAASAHRHSEVGADVCTTAHCQEWKRVDPIVAPEVFRAVSETWGIVAAFDGKLIDAFFFDHCDGHTRSAPEVHMSPVPYLQSVPCDCGFVAVKGHGVGLCQRGAIVMARRGVSFEEILQHYYCYVVIVHSGRDRAEGQSVPATRSTPGSARPAQSPAHGKRPKAPPPPTHKGKVAHKPIPPRRPASAKAEKTKEGPAPVKRKGPPPLPPLPPFLMKKAEADKKAIKRPVPSTPPPSSSPQAMVEKAPPVETPPAVVSPPTPKVEQEQPPIAPPPFVETPADVKVPVSPPLQPTLEEPAPVTAEPLPPAALAPIEPSEPVSAALAPPMPPLAVEPTVRSASPAVPPVEAMPASEIPAPVDTSAEAAVEPMESELPLQVAAAPKAETGAETKAEIETSVELPQVPAYVAALNDPTLLAEFPLPVPAEAEPLSEPISEEESEPIKLSAPPVEEALAAAEPLPEPVIPDSLPELTEPVLKTSKPVRVHIDHLPGERMIAGCLSTPGIMITVLDQRGNETLVMSGSAPHYGEGGFETVVDEDGCYVVWIDGEAIKLEVHCDTAFIHII